jgi:hypothetical protein
MATFTDLIFKGRDISEAIKDQLAARAAHIIENCDKEAVLAEARMIPDRREAIVAFATQHYNKTHGTDFPKHDVHAHLYGGEASEFADHVEKHASPEMPDHLEKNFGLTKNSFMEGTDAEPFSIAEMEDGPGNNIPALSKEQVKHILATFKVRDLPADYHLDDVLPSYLQNVQSVTPAPETDTEDEYQKWYK